MLTIIFLIFNIFDRNKYKKRKKRFDHLTEFEYFSMFVFIDRKGKQWSIDFPDNRIYFEVKNKPTK